MIQFKTCIKCKTTYDISAFNRDRQKHDGYRPYCKICCAEYRNRTKDSRYKKMAELRQKYREQTRVDNRTKLIEYLNTGHRTTTTAGYTRVFMGQQPVCLHRLTYCIDANIQLKDLEGLEVHHLDGDKDNNEADNLIALNRNDHGKLHTYMRKEQNNHTFN